ncbi:cysteine-rich receptor-like protein kinase, partial [Trifolium pratense]
DSDGLWFKVLIAKYGLKNGQIDSGGSRASNWWKVIHRSWYETDIGEGKWFSDNIFKRFGDGEKTLFWKDSWVDEIPLKSQFSRLFELSLNKDSTVVDMFRLGWGYGGNGWRLTSLMNENGCQILRKGIQMVLILS